VPIEERPENEAITTTGEINELLERLKFSEEESVQSLWYTREEVDFVALKEGVVIVKFGCLEDRSRILNNLQYPHRIYGSVNDSGHWECGRLIGHSIKTCENNNEKAGLNVLNLQYGGWMRAPIVTPYLDRRMRRNGVELVKPKAQTTTDKEESHTNSRGESGLPEHKRKERVCEEESLSTSFLERRSHKTMRDGIRRFKSKWKRHRGLNGKKFDESPAKLVKRKILDIDSPFKVMAGEDLLLELSWGWKPCDNSMEGCMAINSKGKSGSLALLWKEGVTGEVVKFTRFYGQANPNSRNLSWDML
ncbi:hypothetical protein Golob_000889, partial [Gossypium lobatum]|nr:hypothetical protein [Gossypium lobatum]